MEKEEERKWGMGNLSVFKQTSPKRPVSVTQCRSNARRTLPIHDNNSGIINDTLCVCTIFVAVAVSGATASRRVADSLSTPHAAVRS